MDKLCSLSIIVVAVAVCSARKVSLFQTLPGFGSRSRSPQPRQMDRESHMMQGGMNNMMPGGFNNMMPMGLSNMIPVDTDNMYFQNPFMSHFPMMQPVDNMPFAFPMQAAAPLGGRMSGRAAGRMGGSMGRSMGGNMGRSMGGAMGGQMGMMRHIPDGEYHTPMGQATVDGSDISYDGRF